MCFFVNISVLRKRLRSDHWTDYDRQRGAFLSCLRLLQKQTEMVSQRLELVFWHFKSINRTKCFKFQDLSRMQFKSFCTARQELVLILKKPKKY